MNGKIVGAAIIIAIISVGILVSGIVPGIHLPGKASIISVSNVNISAGGSEQNSYLVGTDFNVALTVNSFQNVAALELGPSNSTFCGSSICSGQTVTPTSQIYITLTPQQPYVSVPLTPEQSGNEFSNPVVPGICGEGNPVTQHFGIGYTGTQVCTNPLEHEFYLPANQFSTPHFPVTITVTRVGTNPFTFSQQVDLAHLPANQLLVSNPTDPAENITIVDLGALLGNEWPTDVGNLLFYQGCNGWCGFGTSSSDAQLAVGQYANYWFGGLPGSTGSSGYGVADTSYYSSTCSTPPGWGQVYAYTTSIGGVTGANYFYYPIQPSLTQPTSQANTTANLGSPFPGYSDYEVTSSCHGLDLTDYLYKHSVSFYDAYNKTAQYTITPNDTLKVPLPWQDATSVATEAISILIPTTLANAIVYQVNNAQFKITSLSGASCSNIVAGGYGTITGTIKNVGNITGTPQLNYYGNSLFTLGGLGLNSLGPGQSESFSVTATGLNTLLTTKNTITFYVQNDAGQVTDSKQITCTDNPPAALGSSSFTIEGVSGPHSVSVNNQITLLVDVASQGATGTAYLSSSSENGQIAIVAPQVQNATIGGTNTEQFSFSVSGISAGNTTVYFSVNNGQGQSSTAQYNIAVGSSCGITCVPTGGDTSLIEALGVSLVLIAVVVGAWYFHKEH